MLQLGVGRRERRHQHDDVAERTEEDAAVAQRQTDVITRCDRPDGTTLFVARSLTSSMPHIRPAWRMSPTCGCGASGASASRSTRALRLDCTDDGAVREQAERRERRRAAERVAGVGVAVKEVAVLVVAPEKRVVDLVGGERGGDRQVPAGQPLGEAQKIRRHPFALAREQRARAAEAGGHLVENQQRAVLAARRGRAREKSLRQHEHAGRRLHARLEDHGAHAPARARQRLLELVGAVDRAVARRLADRTPIAVRRRTSSATAAESA